MASRPREGKELSGWQVEGGEEEQSKPTLSSRTERAQRAESRDPVIHERAVRRLREGMDYWVPAFAGTTRGELGGQLNAPGCLTGESDDSRPAWLTRGSRRCALLTMPRRGALRQIEDAAARTVEQPSFIPP